MFKLVLLIASASAAYSPVQKTCPPITANCFFSWGTFAPNHPNTYPCWKEEGDWKCGGYVNEKNKVCKAGYVDIFKCKYPVKKPKCPRATDSCVSGDIAHRASDKDAPNCWFQREGGSWECHSDKECDGKKGLVNVKKCFGYTE